MHIPDGYISPQTAVVMYAAAAPFWYIASVRLKKALSASMAPLLGVFSAFSFVIMMFNIPLLGGTTGHAAGVALMAVVLGPWAAILGVSVALVIQALFFGDGGILAIGANCFNIAVVGSLVAYAVYRVIARGAPVTSARHWVGGAIAGYIALNVSALFTAVELGIQPLLFTGADGAPLYNPYDLSIAVPAMMLGHLLIAGPVEAIITGLGLKFMQQTNSDLLRRVWSRLGVTA